MSVEEFSINAILTDQVEDNFLTYNLVGIKIPFLDFLLKEAMIYSCEGFLDGASTVF